jgi:glycosyltransferase involved in cell wall biosynthesis
MLDDWSMAQKTAKKKLYLRFVGRSLLERAAFVHCTAQEEARQSARWFPRGRARVIPNLVDLSPFEALPGPELAAERLGVSRQGPPLLLFVSRLHPKKGLERLIEAVARLRRQGRPHRLLIAGSGESGYEASLRRQVARLFLTDSVHFVGFVRGETKRSLYQLASLFVLPTYQENFGFVLYEALACGTPVLTTRGVDTWRELAQSGAAELTDQATSPRRLADRIAALTANGASLAERAQRGRPWVFDTLDPGKIAALFNESYNQARAGAVRRSSSL